MYMIVIFVEFMECVLLLLLKCDWIFFFDFVDLEKRFVVDFVEVFNKIVVFEKFGCVMFGLNFKEVQQVFVVFGLGIFEGDDEVVFWYVVVEIW